MGMAILIAVFLIACENVQTAEVSLSEDGTTWQEQYDLGMRFLLNGDYQEAILAFTAAIEIEPTKALAYVGRGDAYVLSNETRTILDLAKADYEMAINLDETLVEAWLGMVDVHIRYGEYEEALMWVRRGYDVTADERLFSKAEELENGKTSEPKKESIKRFDSEGELLWYQLFDYGIENIDFRVSSYSGSGELLGTVDCFKTETMEVTYDTKAKTGELIEHTFYLDEGGRWIEPEGEGIYAVYEYDEDGKLLKESYYEEDRVYQEIVYSYRANGHWEQITYYEEYEDITGYVQGVSRDVREFNEDGSPKICISYDEEGTKTGETIYEYDDNGNLLRTVKYSKGVIIHLVEYQ